MLDRDNDPRYKNRPGARTPNTPGARTPNTPRSNSDTLKGAIGRRLGWDKNGGPKNASPNASMNRGSTVGSPAEDNNSRDWNSKIQLLAYLRNKGSRAGNVSKKANHQYNRLT